MAKEYIEREAALKAIYTIPTPPPEVYEYDNEVQRRLRNLPAADVDPVVHGRWCVDEYARYVYCSACESQYDEDGDVYNAVMYGVPPIYCQDCGAKMDGGTENERI